MRLLVLGGTIFLGRHVVAAALARGHEVTTLTRGKHNPDLFPEARNCFGDRDGGLDALGDATWDAVIDTCGYVPRIVRQSAENLVARCGLYLFVSSVSVYADLSMSGADERAPVGRLETPTEEITGESYGPLKALCEDEVCRLFGDRACIVRPGLIVGPHDPTDRFTYWPVRVARGGQVAAPGSPSAPVQVIDGRDLAEWMVTLAEGRTSGVFNAVGPQEPITLGDVLETSRRVSGSDAEFRWVTEATVLAEGIAPWSEMPLWIPSDDPMAAGLDTINGSRAFGSGLTTRPLAETVADTLAWHATRPAGTVMRSGLSPEREAALLRAAGEVAR